jgi:hypothetical protein
VKSCETQLERPPCRNTVKAKATCGPQQEVTTTRAGTPDPPATTPTPAHATCRRRTASSPAPRHQGRRGCDTVYQVAEAVVDPRAYL